MFKNNKDNLLDAKDMEIKRLNDIILDLQTQLNRVANDNGSIIVKMLPDGKVEVNGTEMDNTTEVEYYNSSQATFGELTMFRVGKEAKQREMNKLIDSHMNECDRYKHIIDTLTKDLDASNQDNNTKKDMIANLKSDIAQRDAEITNLKQQIQDTINEYESTISASNIRYEGLIAGLQEDIENWQARYLKLNNITLSGTIITQYGEYINNNLDIEENDNNVE